MTRSPDVRDVARAVSAAAKRLEALRRGARAPGEARGVDESTSSSTFLRGLVAGALVGAAIAGSTIWERRHRRPRKGPDAAP